MRLTVYTLSFVALLLATAIIGPSFVDWNKYKPQIIEQVKNATGLEVRIDGDLSLALLPFFFSLLLLFFSLQLF